MQAAMYSNQGVNAKVSTLQIVQQAPTQTNQNATTRTAHQYLSQHVQPS